MSVKKFQVFDIVIYIVLFIICCFIVLPFLYILSISFTSPEVYTAYSLDFIPKEFSLSAYKYLMNSSTFLIALKNSFVITLIGTFLALFVTFSFAYGLCKKDLPGRKIFNILVIITLLFNAGIIPNYMLIKDLNLMNNKWSVILVMISSAWDIIVVRSFLENLPVEMEEAAMVDGYNDIQIFFKIVLPLSLPCLASFLLIFGVQYWNVYFNSMLYLADPGEWTLQVLVKSMIVDSSSDAAGFAGDERFIPQETIRYASVILSVFPILLVYPFLQKYFVSGLMVGAVKG